MQNYAQFIFKKCCFWQICRGSSNEEESLQNYGVFQVSKVDCNCPRQNTISTYYHLECRYVIYIIIYTYVFIRVISEVFKFVLQHHAAFWISEKGEISKKRPSINLPLGRLIEGQRVNPFTCNRSVVINDKWYTKAVPLFFPSWTLFVGVVVHHVKSDAFGLIKPLVRNGHPFDESKRGYPLVNYHSYWKWPIYSWFTN